MATKEYFAQIKAQLPVEAQKKDPVRAERSQQIARQQQPNVTQRNLNRQARRDFQEEQRGLADQFKAVKKLGSLQAKEAGLKPENYQQMLNDARSKFQESKSALKEKYAQETPNSRFFGTMPEGQKKYLDDNWSLTNPKPANFKELKESGFYAKPPGMKRGGKVKVSSASKRADGIATKGKTRGRMV